ncbi:unnamed protein product [Amoebophrya sp. A25]|nr:unnamed protein product [Amoebophrya sp. A25]|eukprot:GSA25T00021085001.1
MYRLVVFTEQPELGFGPSRTTRESTGTPGPRFSPHSLFSITQRFELSIRGVRVYRRTGAKIAVEDEDEVDAEDILALGDDNGIIREPSEDSDAAGRNEVKTGAAGTASGTADTQEQFSNRGPGSPVRRRGSAWDQVDVNSQLLFGNDGKADLLGIEAANNAVEEVGATSSTCSRAKSGAHEQQGEVTSADHAGSKMLGSETSAANKTGPRSGGKKKRKKEKSKETAVVVEAVDAPITTTLQTQETVHQSLTQLDDSSRLAATPEQCSPTSGSPVLVGTTSSASSSTRRKRTTKGRRSSEQTQSPSPAQLLGQAPNNLGASVASSLGAFESVFASTDAGEVLLTAVLPWERTAALFLLAFPPEIDLESFFEDLQTSEVEYRIFRRGMLEKSNGQQHGENPSAASPVTPYKKNMVGSAVFFFATQRQADEFYQKNHGRLFYTNKDAKDAAKQEYKQACAYFVFLDSVQYRSAVDMKQNLWFQDHPKWAREHCFELPACPFCLERLDVSVSGIVCHAAGWLSAFQWYEVPDIQSCESCIQLVQDAHTCMNCSQSPPTTTTVGCGSLGGIAGGSLDSSSAGQQLLASPEESVSRSAQELWLCLVCGFVGCSRYARGQHSLLHQKATGHRFSLELRSGRIWDYAGDVFVHRRLVQCAAADRGELLDIAFPEEQQQHQIGSPPGASPLLIGGGGGGGGTTSISNNGTTTTTTSSLLNTSSNNMMSSTTGPPGAASQLQNNNIHLASELDLLLTANLEHQRKRYRGQCERLQQEERLICNAFEREERDLEARIAKKNEEAAQAAKLTLLMEKKLQEAKAKVEKERDDLHLLEEVLARKKEEEATEGGKTGGREDQIDESAYVKSLRQEITQLMEKIMEDD